MDKNQQIAATQLSNILTQTGKSVAQHATEPKIVSLNKHMEILKYLKSAYGLGHGNANLLATRIREYSAGGPESKDNLFNTQYSGSKAHLLPIYNEIAAICEAMGDDITKVIQKTGVAFRRNKMFALIQAPSAKRIQIGINLPASTNHSRVKVVKDMCSHRINITSINEVDEQLSGWISQAYKNC
ncbi:MAG: DUF4287 domain-containing protein [Alphaproteobacteria bacterium]|nr:DUF4287 domain-containing protein [Alphaproteobacteria bacterium]